jgi:hypothetical protein
MFGSGAKYDVRLPAHQGSRRETVGQAGVARGGWRWPLGRGGGRGKTGSRERVAYRVCLALPRAASHANSGQVVG